MPIESANHWRRIIDSLHFTKFYLLDNCHTCQRQLLCHHELYHHRCIDCVLDPVFIHALCHIEDSKSIYKCSWPLAALQTTLLQLLHLKCFLNTVLLSYKIISQFANVTKEIQACKLFSVCAPDHLATAGAPASHNCTSPHLSVYWTVVTGYSLPSGLSSKSTSQRCETWLNGCVAVSAGWMAPQRLQNVKLNKYIFFFNMLMLYRSG